MKQLITNTRKYWLVASIVSIVFSCQTDDPTVSRQERDEFNDQMKNLDPFAQPEELNAPVEISKENPERDNEDTSLECYSAFYKAAPGFDEMLALDPTTDVIFPGAILKGETIPTGEYVPIVANRAPITLSASLQNISGSPVVKIESPSLSNVRAGIKKILDQEVTGGTPARINYEIEDVYSEEQLNLALGINYRSAGSKVSSSFDFSRTTTKHKFVLKFLQVYYTIDMDPPKNAGELFTTLPDINALGSTSPVYVSTVTYGRMILYTIESNYSKTEIKAAFDASFVSGDGSIDAQFKKVIDESNIKALVIGGSGASAGQTLVGPEQVYQYIANGGDYTKESPGAPLSYKLRYLKDNTVARVVLSSEYFIRTCDLAYPIFKVQMVSLKCKGCQDGDGGAANLYGKIESLLIIKGDDPVITTWSPTRDKPFRLAKGETKDVSKVGQKEAYRPDYFKNYIRLKGQLKEKDQGGVLDRDDDFGSQSRDVPLSELTDVEKEYTLKFDKVDVKFLLSRVR